MKCLSTLLRHRAYRTTSGHQSANNPNEKGGLHSYSAIASMNLSERWGRDTQDTHHEKYNNIEHKELNRKLANVENINWVEQAYYFK